MVFSDNAIEYNRLILLSKESDEVNNGRRDKLLHSVMLLIREQ
jgi:hypothetical protein